jgi:hypothetical protein
MSSSVITQIADAIVAELNSNTWSLPFTAERFYVPIHDIQILNVITVSVVPRGLKPTLLSRAGDLLYDYFVDIGVQQVIGLGTMTNDEINTAADPLMALCQEILEYFFTSLLPIPYMSPVPRCIDAENLPIYHPPDLDQRRLFTSIITLDYRLGR